MTIAVGLYARISEDRDGNALGVTRQLEDCRKLARSRKWKIIDEYVDNDISAYSGARRPEYERMLEDAAAGRISGIVVWDLDRLTRRPIEIEAVIDLADKTGLVLASVGGDVDLSTDNGRLTARIKGAVARAESERKSVRTKRAIQQKYEKGLHNGIARPFGYRPGGYELDEGEAAELAGAYQKLLAGKSLSSIKADWNTRGILTSAGNEWSHSTVRQLLVRARNAGLLSHRGEIVGPGAWPEVVSEEVWRAACAILADPKRKKSRSNKVKYLLSGIARCGEEDCGALAEVSFSRQDRVSKTLRPSYRCRASYGHFNRYVAPVNEYTNLQVIEYLRRPDVRKLLSGLDKGNPETAKLRSEETAIIERLRKVSEEWADGFLADDQIRTITTRLRTKLEGIRGQLVTTSRHRIFQPVLQAPDPADGWEIIELSQQRAIVDALVEIRIHKAGKGGYNKRRFRDDLIKFDWKEID